MSPEATDLVSTNEEEAPQPTTINVNKAIVLIVEKHAFPTSRSVGKNEATVVPVQPISVLGITGVESKAPDEQWIYTSKALIGSSTLNDIFNEDEKFTLGLEPVRVPTPIKGLKLYPASLREEINSRALAHQEKRKGLVELFVQAYSADVLESISKLGALGYSTDYPPVEVARTYFSFEWKFVSFSISTELEDGIQQLLRAQASELVNELSDKLTPSVDGKRKVFRSTSLNAINEFLETFSARNVTDDIVLSETVDIIKKLVGGLDVETIRNNDSAKSSLATGFNIIKEKMAGLMVEGPRRLVKF